MPLIKFGLYENKEHPLNYLVVKGIINEKEMEKKWKKVEKCLGGISNIDESE